MVDRRTVDSFLSDLDSSVQLLLAERNQPLEALERDAVRAFGVQHLLQISIESLANISNHLASELGWETPTSYVESFENLYKHGVVKDRALAQNLVLMARFRNLVVHRYWKVDLAEVYKILHNHLDDFSKVSAAVITFLEGN